VQVTYTKINGLGTCLGTESDNGSVHFQMVKTIVLLLIKFSHKVPENVVKEILFSVFCSLL